jgi:hypothetical protein
MAVLTENQVQELLDDPDGDWSGAEVERGSCDMCGSVGKRYVAFNMHDGSPMAVDERCLIRHNRRVMG